MRQASGPGLSAVLQDSRHLRAAQSARRTPWWLALLVTLVIFFVGAVVGVVRFVPPGTPSALTSALFFLPALVIPYGVRILLVWLWIARHEGRGFRTLGFPKGDAVLVLRGVVVGLVVLGAMVAVIAAFGGVTGRTAAPGFSGLPALAGALVVLVGWSVQSTTEEILYRGFALQALARHRVWIGVVASSLIFVFVHQTALANPLAAFNIFLAGAMFALYALREGGLWGACGLHAVFNWGQNSLFGFAVSGQEIPGGSLLALQTRDDPLLTGGGFGVEASLPGTVVLLGVIAILLALRNRDRSHTPTGSVDPTGPADPRGFVER